MKATFVLCLALLFALVLVCTGYPRAYPKTRQSRNYEDELRALRLRAKRGWLDCKQEFQSCRGFPPCCQEMVCFWENGWSATTSGKCVSCVDRGQLCQRDGQCCEGLVCQKETTWTVDGTCNVKLPNEAECHDNDQCQSGYCDIHWYNDAVMGHGGKCAEPAAVV